MPEVDYSTEVSNVHNSLRLSRNAPGVVALRDPPILSRPGKVKRAAALAVLCAALTLPMQAGQLHGQPVGEQQMHDYYNQWRQMFNAAWGDWGVPTIQFWASMVGA
jgi:hypothetical protein